MQEPSDLQDDLSLENFSFEYRTYREPSSTEAPAKEERASEDRAEQFSKEEEFSTKTAFEDEDPEESPPAGPNVKSALRAAWQWCDRVANEPNDLLGNLKKQLPLFIIFAVVAIILWILKFIYG